MTTSVYVDGHPFASYRDAASFIGCVSSAISYAISSKRYNVKGHIVYPENVDIDKVKSIYAKRGTKVFVDNYVYESIASAARALGSQPCALRLALETKNSFKGHKIGRIDG